MEDLLSDCKCDMIIAHKCKCGEPLVSHKIYSYTDSKVSLAYENPTNVLKKILVSCPYEQSTFKGVEECNR